MDSPSKMHGAQKPRSVPPLIVILLLKLRNNFKHLRLTLILWMMVVCHGNKHRRLQKSIHFLRRVSVLLV